MNIRDDVPDDGFVVKFGRTNNIVRRSKEHERTYSSIPGVCVCLYKFLVVDEKHTVEAEAKLKSFFIPHMFSYHKFKELAILHTLHEKDVVRTFLQIRDSCSTKVISLMNEIVYLRRDLDMYRGISTKTNERM
jgi:hypothetical protein